VQLNKFIITLIWLGLSYIVVKVVMRCGSVEITWWPKNEATTSGGANWRKCIWRLLV